MQKVATNTKIAQHIATAQPIAPAIRAQCKKWNFAHYYLLNTALNYKIFYKFAAQRERKANDGAM